MRSATRVVLVEPQTPGNIGAIARVMANFGFADLVLVRPTPDWSNVEAASRAMGGRRILEGARVVDDLEKSIADCDQVFATTDESARREKRYQRAAVTAGELATTLRGYRGRIALLIGREDDGLPNEAVEQADGVVTIQTDPRHAAMNISHAVAILLYELAKDRVRLLAPRLATAPEKRRMEAFVREYLATINYPRHKRPAVLLLYRRLLARGKLTKPEFYVLSGIFRRGTGRVRMLEAGWRPPAAAVPGESALRDARKHRRDHGL